MVQPNSPPSSPVAENDRKASLGGGQISIPDFGDNAFATGGKGGFGGFGGGKSRRALEFEEWY